MSRSRQAQAVVACSLAECNGGSVGIQALVDPDQIVNYK
jgi:hypothetical protein